MQGFRYKDYDVFFTGFKLRQDSTGTAGQWIGYPLEHESENYDQANTRPYFYSNVPAGPEDLLLPLTIDKLNMLIFSDLLSGLRILLRKIDALETPPVQ